MSKSTPRKVAQLAEDIEAEATRLAGVEGILRKIGFESEDEDALGVVEDIIAEANARLSKIAQELRGATHD